MQKEAIDFYLNLEFIIMIIAKANNIFYLYNLNLNM